MTTYSFTHLPAKGKVAGRVVIKAPGPAFDLIYAPERRPGENHTAWRLELKSKPPDVALRALLGECARLALESDARLAGSGRVADMLSEPAFAELADFDSRQATREEQTTLTSDAGLRAALEPIARHVRELARRPHVAERFLTVKMPTVSARIKPGGAVALEYAPAGQGYAPLAATVLYELELDRAELAALHSGERLSVAVKLLAREPTPGSAAVWLSTALRSAILEGTLALREGLLLAEQWRVLRQLVARIREPMMAASSAIRVGDDPGAAIARAKEQLVHPDVAIAKPEMVEAIAKRGSGLTPMELAQRERPAPQLERRTIEVPDDLRRFCAIYEWPRGNDVRWRSIQKAQVYGAANWQLSWKAAPDPADGSLYLFTADLESMRQIADGELRAIEVSVSPMRPRR